MKYVIQFGANFTGRTRKTKSAGVLFRGNCPCSPFRVKTVLSHSRTSLDLWHYLFSPTYSDGHHSSEESMQTQKNFRARLYTCFTINVVPLKLIHQTLHYLGDKDSPIFANACQIPNKTYTITICVLLMPIQLCKLPPEDHTKSQVITY